MSDLRILNKFGITPTTSFKAAGVDFYVPLIQTPAQAKEAIEAFAKSYKRTEEELYKILDQLANEPLIQQVGDDFMLHKYDVLHLFLSISGSIMKTSQNKIRTFVEYYLVWENHIPGIKLHCNDHILINSGIKVALYEQTAGIFFNKSGRGQKGFDVRACVVDEDYTGYVHLNVAYTKDCEPGYVFAGDKLTQMVILPIIPIYDVVELDDDNYDNIMSESERGDSGFGSTDNVK